MKFRRFPRHLHLNSPHPLCFRLFSFPQFAVPYTEFYGPRFTKGLPNSPSVPLELFKGLMIGLGMGVVWKMWHWNESRRIEEWYAK